MIGVSKNGWEVYDRHTSHSHCSEADVAAALSQIELNDDFVIESVELKDGQFGFCECVETKPDDIIIYRQRENRDGLTRFVLGRAAEKTSTITLILARREECYILITAFWGSKAEPEPWDKRAFLRDPRGVFQAQEASISFWSNHALVVPGMEDVVSKTIFFCQGSFNYVDTEEEYILAFSEEEAREVFFQETGKKAEYCNKAVIKLNGIITYQ